MRFFALLLLIVGLPLQAYEEQVPTLSPRAAALLVPVLSEYLKGHAEEFDSSGMIYEKPSPHMEIFEARFERLLDTPGRAADEAVAGLMCFYVGDAPAEEMMQSALSRGKSIEPFLRKFLLHPPVTGLEPIPKFFIDIPNSRKDALHRIEAGEKPSVYE